jgi:hypothetical protein
MGEYKEIKNRYVNDTYLIALLEVRDYAHLQASKVSNGFVAREKWHKVERLVERAIEGDAYQEEPVVWEACLQPITDKEWMQ